LSSGLPIGERLRHAREARQLSLAVVAERAGLTKGFVSRVERETTSPSVNSLISICEALGIEPSDIFTVPKARVMRSSDRPSATLPGHMVVDTLLTAIDERKLTVIETLAGPEGSGGEDLYSLPCETEVCYVVEGEIVLTLDTETFKLAAGDSITFDGAVPHTWRAISEASSIRLIWILSPALPDPQNSLLAK
jgi:transcriptional regulator with XRE-family HTH domain